MLEALDGAREWYSKWFWPYPWKELRISEVPGLAGYAQGFPSNIVFSESIGFLPKPSAIASDGADSSTIRSPMQGCHPCVGNARQYGAGGPYCGYGYGWACGDCEFDAL